MFADEEKLNKEACCTFAFKLNFSADGKCLTKR